MNERDVLKKINSLKDFKPASQWKSAAREDLFLRIKNSSYSVKISFWQSVSFEIKNAFSFLSQPAFAVISLFVLVCASAFGVSAARTTKPGDSLYAARVFGEKARVAVTIDRQSKAKLEMKYASTRAKEITEVLSKQTSSSDEKTKRLTEDLKAEIKTVVAKYDEINNNSIAANEPSTASASDVAVATEGDDVAIGIGRPMSEAEQQVFAAGSQKATSGIQISQSGVSSAAVNNSKIVSQEMVATSATSTVALPENDLKKNLSQAVASVETSDYEAANNILKQIDVDKIINSIDQTNKKIEAPVATSVTEIIDRGTISSSSEDK
jgi:septum formation topological specificity factor MinE